MEHMRSTRFLISTLAIALFAGGGSAMAQRDYGPSRPEHRQSRAERTMEQRGFQDGIVGAERDFQNHRRPDVNNRDEYRNPNFIPGWAQDDYRQGFRRGYYQRAKQIFRGGYR